MNSNSRTNLLLLMPSKQLHMTLRLVSLAVLWQVCLSADDIIEYTEANAEQIRNAGVQV